MDGSATQQGQGVVVAVLTFRRPGPLVALLPELVRQVRDLTPPGRIIVVDNDPEAGAQDPVHSLHLPEVTYVHEPRPGIAAGRNAALRAASDAALLAFIDDDETPEPDWLEMLISTHARFGGAAVAGPVLRTHEVEPAAWIRAARVFDRRRLPTGTTMAAAGTGNLLLSLPHVRARGLAFNDDLGLAGGSDHLFTTELTRSGGVIHWCDEAIVHEFVPASRLTGQWTLRRGYRSGATWVRVDLMLAGSAPDRARVRARAVAGGTARVLAGAGRAGVGFLAGDPDRGGRGAWMLARGAGIVGAALGHRYVEYRR